MARLGLEPQDKNLKYISIRAHQLHGSIPKSAIDEA